MKISSTIGEIDDSGGDEVIFKSYYKRPVLTELEKAFEDFLNYYHGPFILSSIEDFSAWLIRVNRKLEGLCITTSLTELIQKKNMNKVVICVADEEKLLKSMFCMTVDKDKCDLLIDTSAQELIYYIVRSFGVIKTYPEMMLMEQNFQY